MHSAMSAVKDVLGRNLHSVQERIANACARAGRKREEITLVAVTKTVSIEVAAALHELGVPDLGESRPQEMWRKAAALPQTVRWHLVGHLQRNKIERTLPFATLIHSVDSLRLLEAIDEQAAGSKGTASILLEVNASRESSKLGFGIDEVPELAGKMRELSNVKILGLMTMAAYTANPEETRPTFSTLRGLRDRLQSSFGANHFFDQLSMGMTNDFEIAIEEGATLIRIGTALFEGLPEAQK
jgi:pyridoxal phosphate enzyme (YggS family)